MQMEFDFEHGRDENPRPVPTRPLPVNVTRACGRAWVWGCEDAHSHLGYCFDEEGLECALIPALPVDATKRERNMIKAAYHEGYHWTISYEECGY